ncbi:MAG: hypothetical protein ACRCXT_10375 [Paraclostridium sp.]
MNVIELMSFDNKVVNNDIFQKIILDENVIIYSFQNEKECAVQLKESKTITIYIKS